MTKYFLCSVEENGIHHNLAIGDKLQDILDYVREIKYQPFCSMRIYTSNESMTINFVDGKIFVQ